jgi:membrane associated rhomboid family serine protease
MIPLKDDNPTQTFPLMTITIIGLNILVYLYQLSMPAEKLESFLFQ